MQELLLPRIAQGDHSAVDPFLDRYGGLVYSLAHRLAPADADDAVQEVFIHLWQNASRFREDLGSEVAFVSTLARRRLIDRRRRAQREPDTVPLEEVWATSAGAAPDAQLADSEAKAQIATCLDKLNDRDRKLIELSVYEGQTQSQIAQALQTPLGTVKTHIRRALIQIRDCMRISFRIGSKGGVLS